MILNVDCKREALLYLSDSSWMWGRQEAHRGSILFARWYNKMQIIATFQAELYQSFIGFNMHIN